MAGGDNVCDVKLDSGDHKEFIKEFDKSRGIFTSNWKVRTTNRFVDGETGNEHPPRVMIKFGNSTLIVTARQFLEVAALIEAAYPEETERKQPKNPVGTVIEKFHRGVKWKAALLEKFYLVTINDDEKSLSIAGDEQTAACIAENLIDRMIANG